MISINRLSKCCALVLGLLFATPSFATDEPVVLVIGDSLSAAYNMGLDEAWPSLLEQRLEDQGHAMQVVNASITGDTTQGGVTRLPRLLERHAPGWSLSNSAATTGCAAFPWILRGTILKP